MDILLSIDIGTTHCKAGLFTLEGKELMKTSRKTDTYRGEAGSYFNPEAIWTSVQDMIREISEKSDGEIGAIGIASMAETGLLLDVRSGKTRTHFIPWFDHRSVREANFIEAELDAFEQFTKTGLRSSYKYGLSKILWLKNREPQFLKGSVWLSASDYIAYRLTGKIGTDPTLAARTFAFRMDQKEWDESLIQHFGIEKSLFPDVFQSGAPIGTTIGNVGSSLPKGIPVAVSGHDHVCAALAVGAVKPGTVYDSVGTAETLVGTLSHQQLGEKEYHSGLTFGCHVAGDQFFWMGGTPSSGGSLEWLRSQLGDPPLSYEMIRTLLEKCDPDPTGIFYFPYLSGSGAPQPDANMKAAFIGLAERHKREHLLKAVLEGTAYEMESIRRSAESVVKTDIDEIVVVGGGTQNEHWMQIKSDVSGCSLSIPSISEATLLGAAFTAGIGCGVYASKEEVMSTSIFQNRKRVEPEANRHKSYLSLYENGYIKLQDSLRQYFS